MSRAILLICLLLAVLPAQARSVQARIARVETAVATLEQVRVRLEWPADAATGTLDLSVGMADAPGLGYRLRDLHWRCPLQRDGATGWRCEGEVRAAGGAPMRLSVRLDEASMQAGLRQGAAGIALDRNAASPDLTRIALTQVPVRWAQALLAQAWPAAALKAGVLDGELTIDAGANRPLRVSGPLALRGIWLETEDALVAGENLGGAFRVDYRTTPTVSLVALDGELRGGEFLAGNTYVALPETPVAVRVDAMRRAGEGWESPRIEWRDGAVLQVEGRLALDAASNLHALDVTVRSDDMSPLKPRYLSGWLGLFGLGDVELRGGMDLRASMREGALAGIEANLHGVDVGDPNQRFVFDGMHGDLRYSAGQPVRSELRWDGGKLYGLEFDAARLPMESGDGVLRFREAVVVPAMDGAMTFRDVVIRPAQGGQGAEIRFALQLDDIDFGKVSRAIGLPPFQGRLSGNIPSARYANERVDFDGGLAMQLFDGRVEFSSLALERPFGSAPSLSADIAVDDLDLQALTEVLGFGSISGRLDGRIAGLRLVDWTPVAFDARFITDPKPGIKQRISQRAVQNISSVGDASFVTSLQGKLIGLFDDFGYRRIGVGCRLANEVCAMSGLHSGANTFTIVEGAGIPRLTVAGFNKQVDWPTLVERLAAVGSGDVSPVVE